MRDLKGLTVVMMGASGGMGTAIAQQLAKHGVNIAVCSSKKERVDELVAKLANSGANAVYADAVNVRNPSEIDAFMAAVHEKFGRMDILINLAGLSITAKLDELTEEGYDTIMDVNVKGTYFSMKSFVPYVNDEEGALIINLSSMAAERANPAAAHYSSAKAAVTMLTDSLAGQLCKRNIRFTLISPGATDTSFFDGRVAPENRGGFMQPTDIAELIEFIATRDSYMNYHNIMLDSLEVFKKRF